MKFSDENFCMYCGCPIPAGDYFCDDCECWAIEDAIAAENNIYDEDLIEEDCDEEDYDC